MSTMVPQREATIEDLYKIDGKAEIVNGRIVRMPPTGDDPGYAGDRVFISLDNYAEQTGAGRAVSDNKGFHVKLPNRKAFSPDAAYLTAKRAGMKFIEGAPAFAVEVRSEGDYGQAAERRMAEKRRDYFAAGTLVVWDVDLLSEDVVKVYRESDPENPMIYRRGEMAEAEPAVPGWRMPVDKLFPPPEAD
ncbi:MAG: Uma2 family endonuclease [Blastocatellia bacterium]